MKQIIAIDIDDTIAESTETLRKQVNQRLGVDLTSEDYAVEGEYWGYYERVWAMHDLQDVRYKDMISEMAVDQSYVPLLPSAQYAIDTLSDTYDIVLITSRDAQWESATRRWLKQHFPGKEIDLYFTDSHRDASKMSKGQLCQQLGAYLLIDDNVEHCESALACGVDAILFGHYGWNRANSELRRCQGWPDVLEFVGEQPRL